MKKQKISTNFSSKYMDYTKYPLYEPLLILNEEEKKKKFKFNLKKFKKVKIFYNSLSDELKSQIGVHSYVTTIIIGLGFLILL